MFDRLYPLLLAAALGAFSGGWIMHQRDQARLTDCQRQMAVERERAARDLAQAQQRAHEQTIALQREVDHAQSEAHKQRQAASRTAAAARTELERLRATLQAAHAALRLPAHPGASCDAGPVCTELLDECASRYQALAADADQLTIDVRALIAAWPRNPQEGIDGR